MLRKVDIADLTQFSLENKTIASLGTTQNSTPTAAQLIGGFITQTGATGAGTVTLPTGALLSAAVSGMQTVQPLQVGDSFETHFANLGGLQNLVITAPADSSITVIGNATIPSGKDARLRFTMTGNGTWDCFMLVSA